MEILKGTSIGEICVTIYETLEGKRLFKINADNEDILPVVDVIEDTLKMYWRLTSVSLLIYSKYFYALYINSKIADKNNIETSAVILSELKTLNIDDLNLSEGTFLIFGKGNKERTGYINAATKEALEKYLEIRKSLEDNSQIHTHALFVSRYGLRLSVSAIKKIVKRAYAKAGITDDIYAVHTLRHTCATLLYRNGTDIKTIQELLGHVQIDTTEIYAHLHDQKVMDAMLEHPLAQFKMANALAFCA